MVSLKNNLYNFFNDFMHGVTKGKNKGSFEKNEKRECIGQNSETKSN